MTLQTATLNMRGSLVLYEAQEQCTLQRRDVLVVKVLPCAKEQDTIGEERKIEADDLGSLLTRRHDPVQA